MHGTESSTNLGFVAQVSLGDDEQTIEVPASLSFPKRITEKPRLEVFPSDFRLWSLLAESPGASWTIRGELGTQSSPTTVKATEVRFGGRRFPYSPSSPRSGMLIAHPNELHVIKPADQSQREDVRFYLTNSAFLEPASSIRQHADGSFRWKRGKRTRVVANSQLSITFDSEDRAESIDNKREVVIWNQLYGRTSVKAIRGSGGIGGLLRQIDDLLLLVALAEDQVSACLEVTWVQDGNLHHLYRVNRSRPLPYRDLTPDQNLIIPSDFETFMKTACRIFFRSSERSLLRNALQALTWQSRVRSVADEFLRHFTAVETITLAFRRQTENEFILSDSSQKVELEKKIREFIRSCLEGDENKSTRAALYENGGALWRVPLKSAVESFQRAHGVRLSDLWPLFGENGSWSLYEIRNKLAHGESISESQWPEIALALTSLRVIAQRFLLCMLGWNPRRANAYLVGLNKHRLMKAQQSLAS